MANYILGASTYVEMSNTLPFIFRLSDEALGLENWSASSLNIDTEEIKKVSVTVKEVSTFPVKADIDGFHPAGTTKLTVVDSSAVTPDTLYRINNSVFKVVAVESSNHILTLDRRIPADIDSSSDAIVSLKLVENPSLLGVYKAEFVLNELGRFVLSVDNIHKGQRLINPVDTVVEVVTTLDSSTGFNGRINTVSNKGIS
ncbi:hypothetical protein ThvES_00019610 [Thiovulum sp. ES]|nr:hypothetical protein ThvES_00019610 [Thiovulum sp. ES]